MAKHKQEKMDKRGWPLFMKLLGTYIELTRFPELPAKPKLNTNYEYWPEGAVCANGKPYHGCIRLGSENKLMVCFSGGGVSVDEYTAARPQTVGGKGQMFYSEDVTFGDIVPKIGTYGRNKKNPFRDWSLLFVPYANGDFHSGTGDLPYTDLNGKPSVLHHHGYTNYRLLLSKMKELVPHPDQIMVTGFSAGAFATSLLTDDVVGQFPDCRNITACVDSALLLYDWQKVAREVWKSPEEIAARLTGNDLVADSLEALHTKRPEVKIMYCCSMRDSALTQVQMYFDNGGWEPDKKAGDIFQRNLKNMMDRLQQSIPDISIFIFDTPDPNSKEAELTKHCLCGSSAAFTTAAEGVTCAEWMKAGVDGKVLKLGLQKLSEGRI